MKGRGDQKQQTREGGFIVKATGMLDKVGEVQRTSGSRLPMHDALKLSKVGPAQCAVKKKDDD